MKLQQYNFIYATILLIKKLLKKFSNPTDDYVKMFYTMI